MMMNRQKKRGRRSKKRKRRSKKRRSLRLNAK